MQTKPIFIGLAAGTLILVIAAASFFAGLYLGQRGYVNALQNQQNLPGNRPNAQLPQGGQLPQGSSLQPGPYAGQTGPGVGQRPLSGSGPAGAPSWPPDVLGRIVSISTTEIVVDSQGQLTTVAVNTATTYLDPQGNPITAWDLQAGFVVAVFGLPTATSVMHLPPPPNAQ